MSAEEETLKQMTQMVARESVPDDEEEEDDGQQVDQGVNQGVDQEADQDAEDHPEEEEEEEENEAEQDQHDTNETHYHPKQKLSVVADSDDGDDGNAPVSTQSERKRESPKTSMNDKSDHFITLEFNRNIFNLYLLLKYRSSLTAGPSTEASRSIRFSLAFLAWFTLLMQYGCFGVMAYWLFELWIDNNDDDLEEILFEWDHGASGLLMFPFFYVATVEAQRQYKVIGRDFRLLKNISLTDHHEVLALKFGEQLFYFFSTWGYYGMLAFCTSFNGFQDYINTVLILVAFVFVLDLDKSTYAIAESVSEWHFWDNIDTIRHDQSNQMYMPPIEEFGDLFRVSVPFPLWQRDSPQWFNCVNLFFMVLVYFFLFSRWVFAALVVFANIVIFWVARRCWLLKFGH